MAYPYEASCISSLSNSLARGREAGGGGADHLPQAALLLSFVKCCTWYLLTIRSLYLGLKPSNMLHRSKRKRKVGRPHHQTTPHDSSSQLWSVCLLLHCRVGLLYYYLYVRLLSRCLLPYLVQRCAGESPSSTGAPLRLQRP